MGALIRLAALGALFAAAPLRADGVEQWRDLIEQASVRFGIPARWIEQVMAAESRGLRDIGGHPIRSRAGAMGLMQLMPATWATMRARLKLGDNPDDPKDNILAGSFYLRLMYDRFGYPGMFAAYNAGPARFARAVATGAPLPVETTVYLAKVTKGVATPENRSDAPLFAIETEDAPKSSGPRTRGSIFAVRNVLP